MSTHREAPHYCTVCNKWFSSESGLLTHCKEHDGDSSDVKNEDSTPCGNADLDSQASETIEVENAKMEEVTPSESQSEEETYECSYCMKLFSDISQFVEHIGICYKLSTTKSPTTIQSSKVSAEVADAGYLKCSFCGCTFSEKCHLDEHVRIHSGEDSAEESYQCQNCSETFSTQSDLTSHMIKHDGDHAFVCIYCSRSFPEQALLEEHLKVHEAEGSPESYQCSECDQFFMRQSDLTKHMKKAHKIFPGYDCSYCGNTFANKNHLTEHERSHTGERPFPCTECEWSFMTKSHLRRHMRTHNRENPLKCSYCSVTFSSAKHLENHSRNAHRCSVRKERFSSKASLIAHSKTHTEDVSDAGISAVNVKDSNTDDHEGNIDTYSDSSEVHDMQTDLTSESPTLDGVTIDECSHSPKVPRSQNSNKTFSTQSDLATHKITHDETHAFSCIYCSHSFPEQSLLEEHLKVHEDSPESYQCSECDQVFMRQSVLTKHMKKAHNILPGYKCSYCGNTFANKNHFTEHERSHTGERPFPCTKCDWSFIRKSHLRNHMRTHVQDTQTELTPENQTLDGVTVANESSHSQDCNKTTFSAQSDVTTHMITPDKDQDFACIHCSHSFPEQALLKEHLKVHDSVGSLKSYQCSECDQVFMRQSVLTKHMKKAHNILPGYKCSYCGSTFANKNHLTEHERSHTGERPFPCTECDWSFMTKSHLRNHMRTHAQENPLKCTYCSATFSKKGLLEEHIRIHTGEEIVEENFLCSECSEIFHYTKQT
nr:zinc finger protein Xfin-like [Lytechinus pictus]